MKIEGIPCPHCESFHTGVLETRAGDDSVKRRRKCFRCDYRFNTVEKIEDARQTA